MNFWTNKFALIYKNKSSIPPPPSLDITRPWFPKEEVMVPEGRGVSIQISKILVFGQNKQIYWKLGPLKFIVDFYARNVLHPLFWHIYVLEGRKSGHFVKM